MKSLQGSGAMTDRSSDLLVAISSMMQKLEGMLLQRLEDVVTNDVFEARMEEVVNLNNLDQVLEKFVTIDQLSEVADGMVTKDVLAQGFFPSAEPQLDEASLQQKVQDLVDQQLAGRQAAGGSVSREMLEITVDQVVQRELNARLERQIEQKMAERLQGPAVSDAIERRVDDLVAERLETCLEQLASSEAMARKIEQEVQIQVARAVDAQVGARVREATEGMVTRRQLAEELREFRELAMFTEPLIEPASQSVSSQSVNGRRSGGRDSSASNGVPVDIMNKRLDQVQTHLQGLVVDTLKQQMANAVTKQELHSALEGYATRDMVANRASAFGNSSSIFSSRQQNLSSNSSGNNVTVDTLREALSQYTPTAALNKRLAENVLIIDNDNQCLDTLVTTHTLEKRLNNLVSSKALIVATDAINKRLDSMVSKTSLQKTLVAYITEEEVDERCRILNNIEGLPRTLKILKEELERRASIQQLNNALEGVVREEDLSDVLRNLPQPEHGVNSAVMSRIEDMERKIANRLDQAVTVDDFEDRAREFITSQQMQQFQDSVITTSTLEKVMEKLMDTLVTRNVLDQQLEGLATQDHLDQQLDAFVSRAELDSRVAEELTTQGSLDRQLEGVPSQSAVNKQIKKLHSEMSKENSRMVREIQANLEQHSEDLRRRTSGLADSTKNIEKKLKHVITSGSLNQRLKKFVKQEEIAPKLEDFFATAMEHINEGGRQNVTQKQLEARLTGMKPSATLVEQMLNTVAAVERLTNRVDNTITRKHLNGRMDKYALKQDLEYYAKIDLVKQLLETVPTTEYIKDRQRNFVNREYLESKLKSLVTREQFAKRLRLTETQLTPVDASLLQQIGTPPSQEQVQIWNAWVHWKTGKAAREEAKTLLAKGFLTLDLEALLG